jgi:cytochrome c peroxidase
MSKYNLRSTVASLLLLMSAGKAYAIFEEQPGPIPHEGECNIDDPVFDNVRSDLGPDNNIGPGSLKTIPVPEPANLLEFVKDKRAAVALGKALFWDMQVGSDGIQACATCHFRAGADPRTINQVAPGGKHNLNTAFDLPPNAQLKASDFPLHLLSNRTDRGSSVLRSSDDVVSSQGIMLAAFRKVDAGASEDKSTPMEDRVFNVNGFNTRRAEPRNTPTVINAVFNHRNFWDGRADNIFNGVNEFGARDPNARVLNASAGPHALEWKTVRIDRASLASQAVGPPRSDSEMGFVNRPFRDIGKRLVSAIPLSKQQVHSQDSVLGALARADRGLDTTYEQLIRDAFHAQWWHSDMIVSFDERTGQASIQANPGRALRDNEYTMMEYNFSLFFGLAIQLYEATLVSDDAKIDRHFDQLAAGLPGTLSAEERRGMELFDAAGCANCHSGPEFTVASVRTLVTGFINPEVTPAFQPPEQIERMFLGSCEVAVYDQGFYNIGVRPTEEDLGMGVDDPFGNPLSIAKLKTMHPGDVPSQELLTINYPNLGDLGAIPPISLGERTSVQGAFKVPDLRNVELTAPYFHNGGQSTLRQVVEFYNRGGDFHDHVGTDGVPQDRFMALGIGRLELTDDEIDAIVLFLRTLTDERVVQQRAPFDHPEIIVPNGHATDPAGIKVKNGVAETQLVTIPAVGKDGGPLPTAFLE